jgi:hypothetical protein
VKLVLNIKKATKLEKKMNTVRKLAIFGIALIGAVSISADDHNADQQAASMVHINLCYLNEGKSMQDVADLNEDFFGWLKSNDLDPYSILLTPMATSNSPLEPTYDFIEMMTGSYERVGEMWDLVQSSDKGQSLLSGWSDIATCVTRFAHMVHKYQDSEALANSDNRVVEFNRCEARRERVGKLRERHDAILEGRDKNSTNMYWGILLPGAGGEYGVFRHLISYNSMSNYTKALEARNTSERWQASRDYNDNYAQCDGPSVWSGVVQNRAN